MRFDSFSDERYARKRRRQRAKERWHTWFAWRPVQLDRSKEWVWLERIQRMYHRGEGGTYENMFGGKSYYVGISYWKYKE